MDQMNFIWELMGKVRSTKVNHRLLDVAVTLEAVLASPNILQLQKHIQVPRPWHLNF